MFICGLWGSILKSLSKRSHQSIIVQIEYTDSVVLNKNVYKCSLSKQIYNK